MKQFMKKNRLALALTIAGIAAGFLYWRLIGCNSGSCPITSNWHASTVFGGLFGFLLSDVIKGTPIAGNKKSD